MSSLPARACVLLRCGAAILALAAAGCSTMNPRPEVLEQSRAAAKGPEQAPFRSITGFAPALRCMDALFVDYGVHDVSLLVEEIADQTKKVNAGTRDMLISAMSDMTRRSGAIRVNAFGRDTGNMISFLATAQRQSAYEVVPQFGVKGSVSQYDENVLRGQRDGGVSVLPFVNIGVSRDAAASVLGLDLSVLSTDDMTVLPGVTSRNSVLIVREGTGADGDAAYKKFGVSYSMSLSKSEGQSQALRGLVELAAVELMGKLTRTPYWTCLGADARGNPEIRREISDWFFSMARTRVELIGYFQQQLRQRGFYDGPVDGRFNPAIDEAIANYRAALGLSRAALLDETFFAAFLAADHSRIAAPEHPAVHVPTAAEAEPPARVGEAAAAPAAAAAPPAGASPPDDGPARLALSTAGGQTLFGVGEPFSLRIRPSLDAHVYCYLRDEDARILRLFPNRFAKDSRVSAAQALELPGRMRFQLVMQKPGALETVACFATPRDVMAALPAGVVGTDFEPLEFETLQSVRDAFRKVAGATLVEEVVDVRSR